MERITSNIRREAARATTRNGILARDAVKEKIRDQDPAWEKLKETTIARKGSSKALIEHGDLLNAITYKMINPYVAFVGVLRTARRKDSNAPLVNIAQVHEFGFIGGVTNARSGAVNIQMRIPPRPYMGPTLREVMPKLHKNWIRGVRRAIELS